MEGGYRHGMGIFIFKNNDGDDEEQNGEFVYNDFIRGTYTYSDGTLYKGDFNNNLHHGKGLYINERGDEFLGMFESDKFRLGILKFKNGEIYEGEFEDELMNGEGHFKWVNGDQFKG